MKDVKVENQPKRIFFNLLDEIKKLESSVMKNPSMIMSEYISINKDTEK